jgi:hypothetical protein
MLRCCVLVMATLLGTLVDTVAAAEAEANVTEIYPGVLMPKVSMVRF